jgi:pimeloyl-[acyl-carrier protein] methyl ester esterase
LLRFVVMSETLKITTLGQGPELVLLHGWATNSGIWHRVAKTLAGQFRVNLVDLPGHGINSHIPLTRDLNAVAEQILTEVPSATWVGWSLGGLIALEAAMHQPLKVEKLVLVSATPSFSKQPDWDCGVDLKTQQAFSDDLQRDSKTALDQFYLQTFGVRWLEESLVQLNDYRVIESTKTYSSLENGLHLLRENNLLPELDECKMPALLLGGSRDRTVKPESLERAVSMMPDASVCLIKGAGHAPFISHEEKFLNAIHGFLQGASF